MLLFGFLASGDVTRAKIPFSFFGVVYVLVDADKIKRKLPSLLLGNCKSVRISRIFAI